MNLDLFFNELLKTLSFHYGLVKCYYSTLLDHYVIHPTNTVCFSDEVNIDIYPLLDSTHYCLFVEDGVVSYVIYNY